MGSSIKLQYRITAHGGTLYVRESTRGEVIGRFPSSKSTRVADAAKDIVAECISVLHGTVESIEHDDDVVHVTCRIEAA